MRMKHLIQFWNRLPAFRVIAQTEHLPTASEKLATSASALSRTIRLLEDEVGHPLFERGGRSLRLNEDGRILLQAVRDAMRRIDDAIQRIDGHPLKGRFSISSPTALVPVCLMPTLDALAAEHPAFHPRLRSHDISTGVEALLEGTLDLMLTDDTVPVLPGELTFETLMAIEYGIYCGAGHPLCAQAQITPAELSGHPFVGPPGGDGDHFPPDWSRVLGMECESLDLGVTICARGRYLAVLPTIVAQHHPLAGSLTRLPVRLPHEAVLSAVYRRAVSGTTTAVDLVLSALREASGRVGADG